MKQLSLLLVKSNFQFVAVQHRVYSRTRTDQVTLALMNHHVDSLMDQLLNCEQFGPEQRTQAVHQSRWILEASDDELRQLIQSLLNCDAAILNSSARSLVAAISKHLVERFRQRGQESGPEFEAETRRGLTDLYRHFGRESTFRHELLRILVNNGQVDDLRAFVETIVDDPPADDTAAAQILTPLFQKRLEPSTLFPRLLDGLSHVSLAAAILDLSNFVTRNELVDQHPATDRAAQLAMLLGEITQRLAQLEEQPAEDSVVDELNKKIAEGVALIVSLCDALALIGDKSVVGKLFNVLELGHRRLRTEAAAALARLGEERGVDELAKMAAEPVVRLRAIAYAEELDVLDKIEDQFLSSVARAEAELVLHLAQPTQLGLPPTSCELVDEREQYWPGYDEPVECFLFRFGYHLGTNNYSNIGIAGPLAHAFTADLADLPPNDIYAAFAGWQAEHADIYELLVENLNETQRVEVARLERRVRDSKYEQVVPLTLGLFFGDKVLVAAASREGTPGIAVADANEVFWYPSGKSERPLGPTEIYSIYKGRKLLRTFNT